MRIFNTDGSVLMEVQAVERNGNRLEFRGVVMGSMPVKGTLSPGEARAGLRLIRGLKLWWFLLTFLFRRSR